MLPIDKLSYWEKVTYFQNVDHLIVGSGIVGLSTALELRKKDKHAKILVLERGYLPSGASTKNAGFACFGSPSELNSDIQSMGEEKTAELLKLRWNGLKLLGQNVGWERIDYKACGSYDLFLDSEQDTYNSLVEDLDYLNDFVYRVLGLKSCYSLSDRPKEQGMLGLCGSIYNMHEGSINTGKMMQQLIQLMWENEITILGGLDVNVFEDLGSKVVVDTQFGEIECQNLFICTNGLSRKLLPDLDLKPARAQVLVTSPIPNLLLDSTYHYDSGYYYFRVIDENRILIGGARNQDFIGETTEEMSVTSNIKEHIVKLLQEVIVPEQTFSIDYQWAGIMGVGSEKIPLLGSQTSRIHYAIRMGGMGVAMGSEIGRKLSLIHDSGF